ncbi:MAG: hypothetical protein ABR584_06095 [Candidatus Baltobacteraceae bacterium]
MSRLTRRFVGLTTILVLCSAALPASAAPKSACQVLPASQAQRILGFRLKAVSSKTTGNVPGTTGTQCDYIGEQGAARVLLVTAASPAAAVAAMQKMGAAGYPSWAMAQKGASFLAAGAGDPPNRKTIKQLLAVGLKSL